MPLLNCSFLSAPSVLQALGTARRKQVRLSLSEALGAAIMLGIRACLCTLPQTNLFKSQVDNFFHLLDLPAEYCCSHANSAFC